MGPYVPFAKSRTAFFHIMLRNWWHDKFRTMSRAGHRYTYRDLLSGNLSISKEIFTAVGGFDSSVRCAGGEDYEFGARLIKAGVPFAFVAEALAYHHEYETTTLDRSLQRSRQEGYADVVIGRRHPELRPTLFLANFQEPKSIFDHIVHGLAYRCPKGGDIAAAWLRRVLNVLETLRVRSLWRKLFIGLRHYWYLRGAAEELGSRKNLIRFFQGSPTNLDRSESEIGIDIANGWDEAEKQLDQKNPTGVRLTYRGRPIGHIPSQPGAEPLRGRHLRPRLVGTELAWLTLRPLIMNDASAQDENVTKPDIDFGEKQCRA
jgi:hypothetical protein